LVAGHDRTECMLSRGPPAQPTACEQDVRPVSHPRCDTPRSTTARSAARFHQLRPN
jgi:hypothetical protein